jgi:hypothetical protein
MCQTSIWIFKRKVGSSIKAVKLYATSVLPNKPNSLDSHANGVDTEYTLFSMAVSMVSIP